MIVKTFSRANKSFGQLLLYIDAEAANPEAGYSQMLLSERREGMVQEFLANAALIDNSKGKNYLYHTVLSFSRESMPYLSDAMLYDLGREFLKLYGEDSLAYAHIHQEKGLQPHLHICHSANAAGSTKRIVHSKEDYRLLKQTLQQYQEWQYPSLRHSVVQHEQKAPKAAHNQDIQHHYQKRGQLSDLHLLTEKVRMIRQQATGMEDFYTRVQKAGLTLYAYRNRYNGIVYRHRKYRFTRLGFTKEMQQMLLREQRNRERYMRRVQEMERLNGGRSLEQGWERER